MKANLTFMTDILPSQDINLSFLDEIADGSNEFMIESIDMFLFHTPESLRIINAAIKNRDWPATTTAAHKLKPNLGFFGMSVCQALMQEIELMAKTGTPDLELLLSKFDEVSELIDQNLISLVKIKAEKKALL